jgi:hypothetical protein
MCNADDFRRPEARTFESIHKRPRVPDQAFVVPANIHRRSQNAMAATFKLLYEKLPAFGSLSAAMNETI